MIYSTYTVRGGRSYSHQWQHLCHNTGQTFKVSKLQTQHFFLSACDNCAELQCHCKEKCIMWAIITGRMEEGVVEGRNWISGQGGNKSDYRKDYLPQQSCPWPRHIYIYIYIWNMLGKDSCIKSLCHIVSVFTVNECQNMYKMYVSCDFRYGKCYYFCAFEWWHGETWSKYCIRESSAAAGSTQHFFKPTLLFLVGALPLL